MTAAAGRAAPTALPLASQGGRELLRCLNFPG